MRRFDRFRWTLRHAERNASFSGARFAMASRCCVALAAVQVSFFVLLYGARTIEWCSRFASAKIVAIAEYSGFEHQEHIRIDHNDVVCYHAICKCIV